MRLWPKEDTTTRFPVRAWREGLLSVRAQRRWRRSHTALTELQLFVCVICAAYFRAAQSDCTNRPYLPTCKAMADRLGLRLRNQDYLDVFYASQVAL